MKFRILIPVFVALVFFLAGCDSASVPTPPGSFTVFLSNNSANERVTMVVDEDTTFADIKTFASTELNLAGQDFELQVAGKTPAPTEKLADHGIAMPDPPVAMPVGNILVRIKN